MTPEQYLIGRKMLGLPVGESAPHLSKFEVAKTNTVLVTLGKDNGLLSILVDMTFAGLCTHKFFAEEARFKLTWNGARQCLQANESILASLFPDHPLGQIAAQIKDKPEQLAISWNPISEIEKLIRIPGEEDERRREDLLQCAPPSKKIMETMRENYETYKRDYPEQKPFGVFESDLEIQGFIESVLFFDNQIRPAVILNEAETSYLLYCVNSKHETATHKQKIIGDEIARVLVENLRRIREGKNAEATKNKNGS